MHRAWVKFSIALSPLSWSPLSVPSYPTPPWWRFRFSPPTQPPSRPTGLWRALCASRIVRTIRLRLPLALHGCVHRDAGVRVVSCVVVCACVVCARQVGIGRPGATASGLYCARVCR